MLEALDAVTFLAPLGSMGEKTRRISALCRWLAEKVQQDPEQAARAGRLSKADLVSAMVGEFDTLQGIMGGIYARKKGETEAVAAALAEQYLPSGPDSPVPATELGSILSIADKVDTLSVFGLGMIPTGAADLMLSGAARSASPVSCLSVGTASTSRNFSKKRRGCTAIGNGSWAPLKQSQVE